MKFSEQKMHQELGVDITPLIDIVFLLLIFFMVSTTFVDTAGIQVNLPKTSQKPATTEQKEVLVIAINKAGEFYYKDSKTSLPELRELFEASASKTEQLVVRADSDASHGVVVKVMDAAQASGITKIAVAAQSE